MLVAHLLFFAMLCEFAVLFSCHISLCNEPHYVPFNLSAIINAWRNCPEPELLSVSEPRTGAFVHEIANVNDACRGMIECSTQRRMQSERVFQQVFQWWHCAQYYCKVPNTFACSESSDKWLQLSYKCAPDFSTSRPNARKNSISLSDWQQSWQAIALVRRPTQSPLGEWDACWDRPKIRYALGYT